jgi:hypothetical protein
VTRASRSSFDRSDGMDVPSRSENQPRARENARLAKYQRVPLVIYSEARSPRDDHDVVPAKFRCFQALPGRFQKGEDLEVMR